MRLFYILLETPTIRDFIFIFSLTSKFFSEKSSLLQMLLAAAAAAAAAA